MAANLAILRPVWLFKGRRNWCGEAGAEAHFEVSPARLSVEMELPVLGRRRAVGFLEVTREMFSIDEADQAHDLLHAQEGGLKHLLRFPYPDGFEVLPGGRARLGAEQVSQARGGEVHGLG